MMAEFHQAMADGSVTEMPAELKEQMAAYWTERKEARSDEEGHGFRPAWTDRWGQGSMWNNGRDTPTDPYDPTQPHMPSGGGSGFPTGPDGERIRWVAPADGEITLVGHQLDARRPHTRAAQPHEAQIIVSSAQRLHQRGCVHVARRIARRHQNSAHQPDAFGGRIAALIRSAVRSAPMARGPSTSGRSRRCTAYTNARSCASRASPREASISSTLKLGRSPTPP